MTALFSKGASLRSRFISGGFWALLGKIISSASTLVANMLLARLLSPEDMGLFFLTFSIVTVFTIIAKWGLGRGIVKLVASELAVGNTGQARSAIITALIITAFMSIILAALLYSPVGEWFLSKLSDTNVFVSITGMLGLWIFVLALQSIISQSFRGYHDIRMATIFGGTLTAVIAMLFYFFVWFKSGSFELGDAVQFMVFAVAISLITGVVLLGKKIGKDENGGNAQVSMMLRFGFPLMLTNLLMLATLEFHMWILAYYQPETEVALYGVSLRLVLLLAMPLVIINAVIPPMIAELYSKNQYKQVQNLLQKTATIIMVPAIIVFLAIIFYGAEILGLVYGDNYIEGYIPFVILAIGQLINVLTGSPGNLLTMSGHEGVVFKTALFSSVLGLVTSLIGVQMYGAMGAALGFTVGITANNVAMSIYSQRKLSIRTYGSVLLLVPLIKNLKYK